MAEVSKTRTQKTTNKKTAGAKSSSRPVTAIGKKKSPAASAKKVKASKPVKSAKQPPLLKIVEQALSDIKAVNVASFDVRELTDVTDTMIIASGNSDRHVRSIAERVVEAAKKAGFRPMGVEGERDGEWVLVDLQDVILHVMLPRVREVYRLESLWDVSAARREVAQA